MHMQAVAINMPDNLTQTKSEAAASANSRNRRQWPRFSIAIPIEVSGLDGGGEPFCERVMTTDVSEWGLGFKLHFALGMDAFVMVRVIEGDAHGPPNAEPVVFQVRRAQPEDGGCLVGVSKMDGERPWCVGLPEAAE
jgi:PilZ domain